jgi:flagellin-like protein
MKKMWKKNNKAVSPVIATILMVAITVVLAAVLYVMVMGFGGDSGGQAPTASLTNSGNRLVLSISESYDMNSTSLQVIIAGHASGAKVNLANDTNATAGIQGYSLTAGGTIFFNDAGADKKISNQDYFTRTGGSPTLIKIVWVSGGTNTVIAEGTI